MIAFSHNALGLYVAEYARRDMEVIITNPAAPTSLQDGTAVLMFSVKYALSHLY